MNFIWETFLTEEINAVFKQARDFSPYYEVPPSSAQNKKQSVIEFNSLYRFEAIFTNLFQEESENYNYTEVKEKVFDIVVHYLIMIDSREGISRKELWIQILIHKLKKGCYGKAVADIFSRLSQKEQHMIAYYLLLQYQIGASGKLFGEVITTFFKATTLYRNKKNRKELLLYIGQTKTEQLGELVQLMDKLFLPLKYSMRVFWNKHFGIIGYNESMELGCIEIF
jgi:hypothetical protein